MFWTWWRFLFGTGWLIKRSFYSIAGRDRLIDYEEWKNALGIRNNLVSRRLFDLVDADHSGYIDFPEFHRFILTMRQPDVGRRLAFMFKVYDLDGDGQLSNAETRQILDACLGEQGLNLPEKDMLAMVQCLRDVLDRDRDQVVNKKDFVRAVGSFPDIVRQIDRFTGIWLPELMRPEPRHVEAAGWFLRIHRRLQELRPSVHWWLGYILANTVAIALAARTQISQGATDGMIVARASGAALNLNMALVLLPMLKSLWSELRHTWVARYIKIDEMIDYHKAVGYSIVVFSLIHIAGHLRNYLLTNQTLERALFHTSAGFSGVAITLAFAIMVWGVLKRGTDREWFHTSHLLYGLLFIGLLTHGPVFWAWCILPAALFGIEAVLRYFLKTRRMKVISLRSLADGVTSVLLHKPKYMHFYPGDYLRLQIPQISANEWHPFTISAAPEAAQFAVHVRNNGDWSGALHNLARKHDQARDRNIDNNALAAAIDGPYGAPTSSVYRSRIAVLVAGGIGVTPFASVLQSILLRHQRAGNTKKPTQRIYFHWLNRSQKSYEWFVELLSRAEQQLGEKYFRLFIHLTSLSHNLSNITMQVAIDAFRNRYKRDPLTNLQAVTSAGRPDWEAIFEDLAREHPDELVDVYFCGPPELAKIVRSACRLQGFHFHQERFD